MENNPLSYFHFKMIRGSSDLLLDGYSLLQLMFNEVQKCLVYKRGKLKKSKLLSTLKLKSMSDILLPKNTLKLGSNDLLKVERTYTFFVVEKFVFSP